MGSKKITRLLTYPYGVFGTIIGSIITNKYNIIVIIISLCVNLIICELIFRFAKRYLKK